MDITVTVRIETDGEEPTVTTRAVGAGSHAGGTGDGGSTDGGSPDGGSTDGGGESPSVSSASAPEDLLARAQAIGAHNAGAAPAAPDEDGPPAFTAAPPAATSDDASYAEGLSSDATDLSAGAAPGTASAEDLAVVTDALPTEEAAGDGADAEGAEDAGTPRRRAAAKRGAKKTSSRPRGGKG